LRDDNFNKNETVKERERFGSFYKQNIFLER